MFDRKKYKKYARLQLKGRRKTPVLMTIIWLVLITLLELPELKDFDFWQSYKVLIDNQTVTNLDKGSYLSELRAMLSILIEYIIIFAQLHVYKKMSSSPSPVPISDFTDGFNNWARAILAGLWETLWTFLWMLLFIIPGIVKHYAYSQTKFLVTEYPELSVTKAMKVSMTITRGNKANLFVMELSFLGWAILAMIPCGLGLIWLVPYVSMTKTNAYHSMLKDAIALGLITSEDLVG